MYESKAIVADKCITRLWDVRYSLPKTENRQFSQNLSITIGANSLEDAYNALREIEPEAEIWQINHRGALGCLQLKLNKN